MASRLATSSMRCLQNSAMRCISLRRGVRSSIYVSRTESQSVRRKAEAALSGVSLIDKLVLYGRSNRLPRFDWPPDRALCVYEIKRTPSSLQLSKPDIYPKPETFVYYHDHLLYAYLLKEDGTFSPKYYRCPPSFLKAYYFTGASFNGLLHFYSHKSGHALWNPTTSEYKILPNPEPLPNFPRLIKWRVTPFGMWCDHKFEDVKVMQINLFWLADTHNDHFYQFNLYSLKTNSWRLISLCTQFHYDDLVDCACISGVVYCKARDKKNKVNVFRSFDLSTETMSTLPFPQLSGSSCKILECKGLLSVVGCLYDEDNVPCKFQLWTMRDGSWIIESVFHTRGVRRMLWFSLDGKLLYFVSLADELVVFDRSIGKLKHLGVNWFSSEPNIIPFVESFGQLNGISHVEEKDIGIEIAQNSRHKVH